MPRPTTFMPMRFIFGAPSATSASRPMKSLPVSLHGSPDIEIGKHLNADVRGRMVELEIVPMPFYKLEK